MQNKPNLLDAQMNVTSFHTVDYENKSNWTLGKNKPNQSQFPKSQNECKLTYNKGLQKKRRFRSPKKQTQFKPNFRKAKMNLNFYLTKDYENVPLRRRAEFKPNQTQFQTQRTLCEPFLFFTFLSASYNLAMQTWTIQKLLNWVTEHFTKKGIDSPRLSAELLLSHILAMKRIELYTQFDKAVDKQQLDRLHELVERAGRNEPVAYLTGKAEFYSLQL
ncbi:unnamed protein product, partial [marine sediment metagenome]